MFAHGTWVIADGGTSGFQGFGYSLVRVHTMMENLSSNPEDRGKYKSGAELRNEPLWPYLNGVDFRSDQEHVEVSQE